MNPQDDRGRVPVNGLQVADLTPRFGGYGDGTSAPRGVCARWMGQAPCGALATMHIIWTFDMTNGPVCPKHDEEARRRWAFVGRHPYTSSCRPGAHWDQARDLCVLPVLHQHEISAAVRTIASELARQPTTTLTVDIIRKCTIEKRQK